MPLYKMKTSAGTSYARAPHMRALLQGIPYYEMLSSVELVTKAPKFAVVVMVERSSDAARVARLRRDRAEYERACEVLRSSRADELSPEAWRAIDAIRRAFEARPRRRAVRELASAAPALIRP